MLSLATLLEDSARNHPDRVALIQGERRLTYREVDAAARRVASVLGGWGIGPGDRVALACPNLAEFPIVYYGILKSGAVVIPMNVLLKADEIEYYLRDSGARAFFCFAGTPELDLGAQGRAAVDAVSTCERFVLIGDAPGVAGESFAGLMSQAGADVESAITGESDTAVVLYTSGTTGQPKGAELTHCNLVLNALGCNRLFQNSADAPDTMLVALPLFHTFGATVLMNGGFASGSTLVLVPRFTGEVALQAMIDHEVTMFAGVPTMYWAFLHSVDETVDVARIKSRLRLAISGGAALPLQILDDFAERFGVGILEGYGLSETSPVATFNHLGRPAKAGSIGQALWGVEVRLVDDEWNTVTDPEAIGEIAIRGYNVMKGYLDRPEETAAVMHDGWFRTGDLARRDAEGYYFIVDRAKDMLIRSGFNVYPREIEEVLMRHPAVSLVAVIGVPSPEHGDEVKACVVKMPGDATTEQELIDYCKQHLAAYKYPRIVEFVDGLPMTSSGKILKRELR
jgi:long-chain acyl-CoA synthetase